MKLYIEDVCWKHIIINKKPGSTIIYIDEDLSTIREDGGRCEVSVPFNDLTLRLTALMMDLDDSFTVVMNRNHKYAIYKI